jgi:hypothetical protein
VDLTLAGCAGRKSWDDGEARQLASAVAKSLRETGCAIVSPRRHHAHEWRIKGW